MSGTIQPGDFLPVIPSTQPPPGGQTAVLALAHLHLKAGWHPAPVHGFTLPLWYRGTYDEQEAARERAVIFDRSHLGRFYVTGERAAEVLGRLFATDPARIARGRVGRALVCRNDGTIFDIATLCHLDEGRWLVISGPRTQISLRQAVEAALQPDDGVEIRDRLGESVMLAVAGPGAQHALHAVVGSTMPDAVPPAEAHEVLLGGYRALVAHDPELGEDGFWFITSAEVGEHLWENSVTVGIEPAGLAAWDTMRIEAGAWEAPTETPAPATPYHAGLGHLVDGAGERSFPGSHVLSHEVAPERLLTGLRLDGPRLAKRGSRIRASGAIIGDIGACVNAVYSSALAAGIAVAYLPPGLARVEVDTDGQWQPADIVPLPFIDGPRVPRSP
jgi:aminomethyltransferase